MVVGFFLLFQDFLSFPRGDQQDPSVSSSFFLFFLTSPEHTFPGPHLFSVWPQVALVAFSIAYSAFTAGEVRETCCLAGTLPSHLQGQARRSLWEKNVIIGLVNFKFTFCATSNWEGNYDCPFVACKSCWKCGRVPSTQWWACLTKIEATEFLNKKLTCFLQLWPSTFLLLKAFQGAVYIFRCLEAAFFSGTCFI